MNCLFSFNCMPLSLMTVLAKHCFAKSRMLPTVGVMLISMVGCVSTVPYRDAPSLDAYIRAPIDMLDQLDDAPASVDSPVRSVGQSNVLVVSKTEDANATDLNAKDLNAEVNTESVDASVHQDVHVKDAGANKGSAGESEAKLADSLLAGLPPIDAVYEPHLEIGDRVRVSYYQRPAVQKDAYLINPSDVLSVDVLDHPELSRPSVLVLPDGFISVPLTDRIQAVGKTTDQLGLDIESRLSQHKISDPVVSVAVQRSQSALVGLMNMLQGRDGREPLTFIVDGAGTLELPLIEPISTQQTLRELRKKIKAAYLQSVGPLLEVSVEVQPIRPLAVYVVGEVGRPGNVTFENGLHPFMAISTVGGFLPTANLQQVRLFRADAKGQLRQWRIDMASEDQLFAHGVKLLPRDILFIPRSGIAEANQRVDQYVRRLLPVSIGVGANFDLND